jgi:hypothetical protein
MRKIWCSEKRPPSRRLSSWGRRQAAPEGLLDHQTHAGPFMALPHPGRRPALRQVIGHRFVEGGRQREVEEPSLGGRGRLPREGVQASGQARIGRGVLEIALDVEQPLREAAPGLASDVTRVRDVAADAFPERRVVELLARQPDDGDGRRQEAVERQMIEGGQQLPPAEVAPGPERHDRARRRLAVPTAPGNAPGQVCLPDDLFLHRDRHPSSCRLITIVRGGRRVPIPAAPRPRAGRSPEVRARIP